MQFVWSFAEAKQDTMNCSRTVCFSARDAVMALDPHPVQDLQSSADTFELAVRVTCEKPAGCRSSDQSSDLFARNATESE